MKSLDKKKPKELECWEKELDILFSNKVLLGYEPPTISLKEFIKQILTQQRTELINEQFEKAETEAEIASKAYDQGYLDCQKGRKKAPHDTREGYCCACDYDLACFEEKLKETRTELLEEIKDLQTYVLFNDTEKLISLEQVINLLNKKDE